ncbi:2-amino-4-hydroxy-6-hydroxymethyldihydropteridine diphosphokinase [Marinomonas epiphytica]
MIRVYIGMGSNLDNPKEQLLRALHTLQQHPDLDQVEVSNLYSSKPVGPQDQPDFVNAVASFSTLLSPHDLLDVLQGIEQSQRRVRERHWGPRTLDLDILLYGSLTIEDERLTVPHRFMLERGFVMQPLCDLAADLVLPDGQTVTQHLEPLDTSDLVIIKEE